MVSEVKRVGALTCNTAHAQPLENGSLAIGYWALTAFFTGPLSGICYGRTTPAAQEHNPGGPLSFTHIIGRQSILWW